VYETEVRQHVKDNCEQLPRHPTLAWSLPIRDQRGRFTAALCSFVHDGVGLDTVGRYVEDKSTTVTMKCWSKVYRRRWEDTRVLGKGCVEGDTGGTAWCTVTNCCHHCNETYSVVETGQILNWLNAAFEIVAYLLLEKDPIPTQTPTALFLNPPI